MHLRSGGFALGPNVLDRICGTCFPDSLPLLTEKILTLLSCKVLLIPKHEVSQLLTTIGIAIRVAQVVYGAFDWKLRTNLFQLASNLLGFDLFVDDSPC